MNFRGNDLPELDRASFFHPFTALGRHAVTGPRIFSRAEGATLTDINGASYVDGFAGLWCVNVGYGRREIADAVSRQIVDLSYIQSFGSTANEPSIRLAHRIAEMVPIKNARIFFGNSGSDANDTNIKIVWHYNNVRGRPRKKKIVSRRRSYHGSTIVTGCLSGLPTLNRDFDEPTGRIRFVSPACYYWRPVIDWTEAEYVEYLLCELEQTIVNEGPDTIAAFLAEPMMGAGGAAPPPTGYWAGVQEILKRHDILLVADEVITGFGRLGYPFASELYEISPDIMTLAKGLTSGYLPMSASVIGEEIWSTVREGSNQRGPFGHGFTYSAHPVAAAAAMANLDILESEHLIQRAGIQGKRLLKGLRDTLGGNPAVGDIRGEGLIAAVELTSEAANAAHPRLPEGLTAAQTVVAAASDAGVLVRALNDSNIIASAPPFVASDEQIDAIVAAISGGVEQVCGAQR